MCVVMCAGAVPLAAARAAQPDGVWVTALLSTVLYGVLVIGAVQLEDARAIWHSVRRGHGLRGAGLGGRRVFADRRGDGEAGPWPQGRGLGQGQLPVVGPLDAVSWATRHDVPLLLTVLGGALARGACPHGRPQLANWLLLSILIHVRLINGRSWPTGCC